MAKANENNPYIRDIDLNELIFLFWEKKFFITISTLIFAILSVLFSLSLTNIYKSEAILIPTMPDDSLSSKISGFSSLASISGIGIPSTSVSKSEEGIERIKSFQFFSNKFLPSINLEDLVAVKDWDQSTNTIIYDNDIFFEKDKSWDLDKKPTQQEAYAFYKRMLNIRENKETQFVSISVKHVSPFKAKEWVDIIIFNINETMREADRMKAEKSIEFLSNVLTSTNLQPIKDSISSLMEAQLQISMLASSSEYYVFKVLDASIVPERKFEPRRSVIVFLGSIIGFMLSIIFVFIRYLNSNK